jgi:hypothetical protein
MEMETPQPEDLDSEEHDAFGGAPPPPADHDVDWRPDRPARRPVRKWIAAGVAQACEATARSACCSPSTGRHSPCRTAAVRLKVTTTASTQVTKVVNGTEQPSSLSALTVGELTIVRGTTVSDGTVAATAIRQGGGPGAGGGPGFGPPGGQQQQTPQQNVSTT